jgi:hypothetical protein
MAGHLRLTPFEYAYAYDADGSEHALAGHGQLFLGQ